MITKKRVFQAVIALDVLLVAAVLALHLSGRYQQALSVGGVRLPVHDSAYVFAQLDANTFIATSAETSPGDIAAFYSERLAEMGWRSLPGERYQDSAAGGAVDRRIVQQHLLVFAEAASTPRRYLLVAVGLFLPPTLCGDSHTTVIVRATLAPTASARAAEGFALFAQTHASRPAALVAARQASCSG